MASITHAPGNSASTRKPTRDSRSSSEHASDQIRGFYYDVRRAALGHDYLRRKWLPREGPLFYAFIQVMRGHCYYNAQTGEIRESCYPKVETIAKECGVDAATIHRLIQRDKTSGEFVSKHAEALKRFIKVQPRWLYDPRVGHKTQRSSLYLVALDDPPVPEDDHLVEEKEGELAAILTMERVRQQHQAVSASAPEEECTDLQNASQLTLAKCESVMSRNLRDKTLPLTLTSNNNLERTFSGCCLVDWPIGNEKKEEKALVGDEPTAPASEEQVKKPSRSSQPSQPGPSEGTKRHGAPPLAQAHPLVGAAIHQALLNLGGSNPAGGVQTILEALVEVAAPPERMEDLFALGQRRLAQQQELLTVPNHTGYLIGIMRNVAVEAMVKGWNVAQMRAEDEEKHVYALRSAARADNGIVTSEHVAAGEEEVLPPEALGWTDVDPRAALTPEKPDGLATEGGKPEATEAEAQERQREGEVAHQARHQEEGENPPRQRHPHIQVSAKQVWQSTLERIQPKISHAIFNTWFGGTSGQALNGHILTVGVPTTFGRSHLETRFHDLVCSVLYDLIGPDAEVCFELLGQEEHQ